jgi:hypothetical protein
VSTVATSDPAKLQAVIQVVRAVADAIKELGSVPSGHLYAQLMCRLELREYGRVIEILVDGGLVQKDASHLLTWIGPR